MSYDLISSNELIAKKQHSCFGCCGKINPGDRYLREVGTYYKDFQVLKFCPKCLQYLDQFFDMMRDEWGGSWEFSAGDVGEFWQDIEDEEAIKS